tara:strand:+ start:9068 stop:10261 length:1194 start_codon:yes stop_codon:yes gene_type:complete
MQFKQIQIKKYSKQQDDKVTFIASTDDVDRYSDIIDQDSWLLENYKNNPVILFNHNSQSLPIGRGHPRIENGKLMIDVEFDMEDELGAKIANKVKNGFMNAVSVGFNPKKAIERSDLPTEHKYYGERGMFFQESELLEVSVVTIPANASAIAAKNLNLELLIAKLFDMTKKEYMEDEKEEPKEKAVLELDEDQILLVKDIIAGLRSAVEMHQKQADLLQDMIDMKQPEEESDYDEDEDTEEEKYHDEEDEKEDKYLIKKTDFPKKGDDEKISMRNSNHKSFPLDYAKRIREDYPEIWRKGGNIKGNAQFAILSKIQDENNGVPKTKSQEDAIKLREAWAARHKEDFLLAGVVAQMKWLVIGSRGLSHMKEVINEEIKKQNDKSLNQALLAELLNNGE